MKKVLLALVGLTMSTTVVQAAEDYYSPVFLVTSNIGRTVDGGAPNHTDYIDGGIRVMALPEKGWGAGLGITTGGYESDIMDVDTTTLEASMPYVYGNGIAIAPALGIVSADATGSLPTQDVSVVVGGDVLYVSKGQGFVGGVGLRYNDLLHSGTVNLSAGYKF